MAPFAKRQSLRMFENEWLEKLSHVHPVMPALVWLPVALFLFWRSAQIPGFSLGLWAVFAGLGLLSWSLTEYLLHRFVFHYQGQSRLSRRIHFIIHGVHHDDPEDATRLVMPPVAAIVLAALLYAFFRWIWGPVWVNPFFGFFLIGYLIYDYTHYYVHHFTPKTRWGRYLKQYHMLHHFASPEAKWGVSSPLWDYVFGTVDGHHPHPLARWFQTKDQVQQ